MRGDDAFDLMRTGQWVICRIIAQMVMHWVEYGGGPELPSMGLSLLGAYQRRSCGLSSSPLVPLHAGASNIRTRFRRALVALVAALCK